MKSNLSLHRVLRSIGGLACVAGMLLLDGCGNSGKLSGKLTLNGQPLPKATITFLSEDGKTAVTKSDGNGNYTTKIAIGKYGVSVSNTDQVMPGMMAQMMSKGPGKGSPKDTGADINKGVESFQKNVPGGDSGQTVAVPQKYNDPKTSGLTVEVKGGSQPFDILLSD